MRVHFRTCLIATLLSTLPLAAQAQSLPDWVEVSGRIEYEGLRTAGPDESLLYADLDVSFDFGAGSMGLGLDLGVLAYDANNSSDSAIFAALTYGTPHGKFSIGAPRGALGDYSRMPAVGGISYLDLEMGPFTRGFVDYAALSNDETPLGLRYDGQYGSLAVSASYHNFNDLDAEIVDLAASYESGIFFVTGGLEFLSDSTDDVTLAHIELGAKGDYYSAGIGFTNIDSSVPDATMAWASYSALPNTDLTLSVFDTSGTTIWGLSGEWRFLNYSFVQLGVADVTGGDTIWDASIGLRF
ncbi:MAG: hypothetical protein H6904_07590 [Rhodobacteraceae bacterium]|nr:hypothetical protein [Paracoccaceae bacterium]